MSNCDKGAGTETTTASKWLSSHHTLSHVRSKSLDYFIAYMLTFVRYERLGTFRLLDMPAELRTRIYHMAFVFPGKIYPQRFTAQNPPTSVAARLKYSSISLLRRKEALDSAPKSALELLCSCRQIRDEALGIFYWHNDFVFSSPTPLVRFLSSLTVDRIVHVRNITVFYHWQAERNRLWLYDALVTLKLLPNLRKLHVLLPETYEYARYPGSFLGAPALFQLRGLNIIEVRDLRLLDDSSRTGTLAKHAWRHFDHGLALAQKGVIIAALYQDDAWYQNPTFPVLQGSRCSVEHGCNCPEPWFDEEEWIEDDQYR